MSINNNEITIKYFYEGNKLYRLVYTVDDKIANAIPPSHKQILNTQIQEATHQVLSEKSNIVNAIRWEPGRVTDDITNLDQTLTQRIHEASLKAASSIFNPPSQELSPGSLTISPGYANFDSFIKSLCQTHLTDDERASINRETTFEDKKAVLLENFKRKNDPNLFKKIAQSFSDYLKNPKAIKELTLSHFGHILELLKAVSVPQDPLANPGQILLKLHPYLAKNKDFKDNLELFCNLASISLSSVLQGDIDQKTPAQSDRSDPLDSLFANNYHTSCFSQQRQLQKFYDNLNRFIKNPEVKTVFDKEALSSCFQEESSSRWIKMPESSLTHILSVDDMMQKTDEPDEAFEARLDQKIEELKKQIGSDIEGLSYTITSEGNGPVELVPDMSLEEQPRHDKLLKNLKPLFDVIATYPKDKQIAILACMTQKFLTASTLNDEEYLPTKEFHKGLTIVYDPSNLNITIFSQISSLMAIPENRDDTTGVLKAQDIITCQAMALFSASSNGDVYQKQFKKPLQSSDYFEPDPIYLSLM